GALIKKSLDVSLLLSSLVWNMMSCSPSWIAHLATRPYFSGFVSACLIEELVRTITVVPKNIFTAFLLRVPTLV
nr:hypothetical protein [Tanacetum cinerariifolium]